MSGSLLTQGSFSFLSVPNFQPLSCNRDGTNQDEAFYSGSPCKERMPDLNKYVPLNYISPEAYAFLLSAEASAARRAEERDDVVAAMESDAHDPESNLQNALAGWQSPSLPPPKKFYRTFWHSISLRLLRQRARVLLLSSRPATVPMQA